MNCRIVLNSKNVRRAGIRPCHNQNWKEQVIRLFTATVVVIHGLLLLAVFLLGIGPFFSIAAPDPDPDPALSVGWVVLIISFMALVFLSAFVQLKVKKVWSLLVSIIGLLAFFVLTLHYIYPFIMNFFTDGPRW